MLGCIEAFQVAHQGDKGSFVGVEVGARVGRKNVNRLTVRADHAREPFGIGLRPLWRVMHVAVFPSTKPKQHHMEVVLTGAVHNCIDVVPIELLSLRLNLLPVDRGFHRVGVQFRKRFPDRREF